MINFIVFKRQHINHLHHSAAQKYARKMRCLHRKESCCVSFFVTFPLKVESTLRLPEKWPYKCQTMTWKIGFCRFYRLKTLQEPLVAGWRRTVVCLRWRPCPEALWVRSQALIRYDTTLRSWNSLKKFWKFTNCVLVVIWGFLLN